MTTTKTRKLSKKQKLINASVRRANARYNKASAAGRRVLIAKDALKQITDKKYNVQTGVFADFWNLDPEQGAQLQPLLHDPKAPVCEVCGIGSLFLSAVRMRNDYKLCENQCGTDSDALHQLKEFDIEQRRLIEMAFESGKGYYSSMKYTSRDQLTAARWALRFGYLADAEARLIAILKNIIRNRGRFNPRQK